jgi:hypothetical protein
MDDNRKTHVRNTSLEGVLLDLVQLYCRQLLCVEVCHADEAEGSMQYMEDEEHLGST